MFLATEDVHGAMQPADGFTWMMAAMLFAQTAVLFAAFGSEKRLRGTGM
jgi:hypothetical protein